MSVVTDEGEEILATYNLMLIGPASFMEVIDKDSAGDFLRWPEWLAEAEENLTDLVPPKFRVVIKEWSSDE